jgi:hypothetical protein
VQHPVALIGERILTPCPAGLVVPAVVNGQPVGATVVHLFVRNNAPPLACPVCKGRGQIAQDPTKMASPNIGYTEPEEPEREQKAGPRLVVPN